MAQPDGTNEGSTYEIRFQGRLGGGWAAWLGGLLNTREVCEGESQVTCLTVRVPDQSALRGLLNRLWDLHVTLISIRRIAPTMGKETEDER